MALAPGTRLGPYEVLASIGAGGMGEVYRARDTTLERDVALKILPDAFATNADRVQRFTREAQTLAALNHPNIAHIYGIEDRGDTRALVMEFVEGEDLATRLLHGPLALADALPLARQLADALLAAHDQGIIHRDLKPANIKVRPDGTLKVLDFGLAKILDPDPASAIGHGRVTVSPTITSPAITGAGVLLGTAAYMSPEQARGQQADTRSDIWAFGCVLYEMLSGARPFDEPDVADTLAAVLMREPDWARLPPRLPRSIQLLLRRCLERERAKRMTHIAGALFALEETLDRSAARAEPGSRATAGWQAYSGWLVAALAVGAAVLLIRSQFGQPTVDSPIMRLQIEIPPGGSPVDFALSPDGQSIVFDARVNGRNQLILRRLESEDDRPLPGTVGGLYPFWSPDSQSLAYFADGSLKRLDLASGFVRTITSVADPRRGAWNRDGTILFASSVGPILKVPATGGSVVAATALLPGQSSHRFAQFLPDGHRFVLLALGESSVRGLYSASLDDKELTRISDGEPAFTLLPSFLLMTQEGALWARRLDPELRGSQNPLLPVASRIMTTQVTGLAALSSSSIGSFAYRAAPESRQLVWLDRAGRQLGVLGQPDDGQPNQLRLSSDGRTVAVIRTVKGNRDVWLANTARATFRRLTFGSAVEGQGVFSPDDSRVAFASDPKGTLWDIYEQRSDGTGGERLLRADPENESPLDWSPDGRHLLYLKQDPKTDFDLWALPLFSDRAPFPVAQTSFREGDAQFSPSGRWIAFESDETGRSEVYLKPFPGPGARLQISIAGGKQPRWPRGGQELFYIAPDHQLMAVTVTERGAGITADAPRGLLTLRDAEEYVPSRDGQRFLVNRIVADPSPITIVLNWKPPPQP